MWQLVGGHKKAPAAFVAAGGNGLNDLFVFVEFFELAFEGIDAQVYCLFKCVGHFRCKQVFAVRDYELDCGLLVHRSFWLYDFEGDVELGHFLVAACEFLRFFIDILVFV